MAPPVATTSTAPPVTAAENTTTTTEEPVVPEEPLKATFLGKPVDLTEFACNTKKELVEGNAGLRFCHPGGPVIVNLIRDKEVMSVWNSAEQGIHTRQNDTFVGLVGTSAVSAANTLPTYTCIFGLVKDGTRFAGAWSVLGLVLGWCLVAL